MVTPGHQPDGGSNVGKRVRPNQEDTSRMLLLMSIPDPGHPTPRRWKILRTPSSEGVGGEADVPRNLFPRLGVG